MIKKVTIKKITKYERPYSKEGEEQKPLYTFKTGDNRGKNFKMVTIQTEETGDEYFSTPAMESDKAMSIEVGQKILLNFTETKSDDGTKTFKNFNFPTKAQLAEYAESL
jgi:general stress protein 26